MNGGELFSVLSGLTGRLHPMVLHLPIGLLLALAVVEFLGLGRHGATVGAARRILAWVTAASTVIAVITGYVLSLEDGYGGVTLDRHFWLGLALAGVCVAVALLAPRSETTTSGGSGRSRAIAYRMALVAALLLVVPVGHLGASMTHGSDFLFEPLRAGRAVSADPEPALPSATGDVTSISFFESRVQPILDARCTSCHGPSKRKGGLALHDRASIEAGGATGLVIDFDAPLASELLRRVDLPTEHDEHMPPDGKPQPTAEELIVLRAWLERGASFDEAGPVGSSVVAAEAAPAPSPLDEAAPPAVAPGPPPAPAQAIEALRAALLHVERVHDDTTLLWIDAAAAAADLDDDAVDRLLEPVRMQVGDLTLARSAITDRTAALLRRMPSLERLDVGGTALTDAGVAVLDGHPTLREIVLVGTSLSDGAVESIAALPALETVYLWSSGVTPEGVRLLASARPSLRIDAGDEVVSTVLETEPVVLVGDAEPVASGLTPVNSACPVTGSPVDPRYAVVHEGRVVGFCCPNCPSAFWEDPAAYAVGEE